MTRPSRSTALLRIGFTDEAARFKDWLKDRWQDSDDDTTGPLQLMYGIDGRSDLTEQTLDHLEGYRGSSPVRIGNGAHRQLQLDIYGELMDAVYLHNKYVAPIGYDSWRDCDDWSTGSARIGSDRTTAFGKCAAARAISFIRNSCRGSRWTAACGWPTNALSRPTGHDG